MRLLGEAKSIRLHKGRSLKIRISVKKSGPHLGAIHTGSFYAASLFHSLLLPETQQLAACVNAPLCKLLKYEWYQRDQKKIAKCLSKSPKNDFTRKMIDFDTFPKIA